MILETQKKAEDAGLSSQPEKMMISGFTLKNGNLFNPPLLLIYLQRGVVCTKTHHCVDYTQNNCFNSLVQSAVDARRQSDQNSYTSVVAETMMFRASNCYGHQIMHCSWHTLTKYLSDKNALEAFDRKVCKKLDQVNNLLYDVGFAKAQIEHTELIKLG